MTAPATIAEPILPGATIGIVGGGQLGRMLALTARRQGYRVAVLTGGDKDTPAGAVADVEISGGFDDDHAVAQFVSAVDVVTWEFENVDTALADAAAQASIPVRPAARIIAIAQDREREKLALEAAGVTVAPWRVARSDAELGTAVGVLGGAVIAKSARFGYDGKGQARLESTGDAQAVWDQLGRDRLVVESVIPFVRELSVIVARGVDGAVVDHGVMENTHADHILDVTVAPGAVTADVAADAVAVAHRVAETLDLVGVLCVEFFQVGSELIVNEIAPRPHNSGHLTIEAAPASQFEQQLRSICGLPLGDGTPRPAAMAQLLGDLWSGGEPDWTHALSQPDITLHLYGKAEPRPGRKMGHLTCVDDDAGRARQRVIDVRAALRRT